jgi:hypothetical protein
VPAKLQVRVAICAQTLLPSLPPPPPLPLKKKSPPLGLLNGFAVPACVASSSAMLARQ